MKNLMKFKHQQSGATMVEYAILVALISVAAIVTINLLGAEIHSAFQNVLACIKDPGNATTCP